MITGGWLQEESVRADSAAIDLIPVDGKVHSFLNQGVEQALDLPRRWNEQCVITTEINVEKTGLGIVEDLQSECQN
jgi:hypothetical protein